MLRADQRAVDDVLRLSGLPLHRLYAALAVLDRAPQMNSNAIGLTLRCSDSAQAVERFGCGDADEPARAIMAEEGHALFETFIEEHGDAIRELTCRAWASSKSGLSDESVFAAVAVAIVADILETNQRDERALVLASLLLDDSVVLRVCGELDTHVPERVRPEQLS